MIRFAKATEAPAIARGGHLVTLGLAAVLVVMAIGQLFDFEETTDALVQAGFAAYHPTVLSYMAVLAVCEVMALPFLLRMRLSPLMRILSAAFGWAVGGLWLGLTLIVLLRDLPLANIGFFGDKIPVPVGWWCVVYSVMLIGVMTYSTWLLRPLNIGRLHKK